MKKILMFALAAVTMLSSCSKEDSGTTPVQGGEAAKLRVSFTIPATVVTTRADQAASAEESTVNTAAVYVFDANGIALSQGGFTKFGDTANGEKAITNLGSGVYTMSEDILALVGNVKIYVGLNMPASVRTAYGTEAALLAATAGVSFMSNGEAAAADKFGFTMFTAVKTTELKDKEDASLAATDGVNVVSMTIDRVVSKVVASSEKATYTNSWTNGTVLTYTIDGFNVYNEANTSYLVERAATYAPTATNSVNAYAVSVLKDNKTVGIGEYDTQYNTEAQRLPLAGYYVGENKSNASVKGTTTHAFIATKVAVNQIAKWNGSQVAYETSTLGADDDVIVIKHEGATYVTSTANKTDLLDNLTGSLAYTYHEGYVHFRVWLNKKGNNNYEVGRNEFIHMHIESLKQLDGIFPGYPGDETNPDKPIDPESKPGGEGGNNPDPIDPKDPVDGEDAALNVKITVNPWTYVKNAVELQ